MLKGGESLSTDEVVTEKVVDAAVFGGNAIISSFRLEVAGDSIDGSVGIEVSIAFSTNSFLEWIVGSSVVVESSEDKVVMEREVCGWKAEVGTVLVVSIPTEDECTVGELICNVFIKEALV